MVFQNYALYPHMTVRKNMEYGLKNQGMPKPEIAADRRGRAHPARSSNISTASPARFRAGSGSASPWAAPSCGSRPCSSSTSRLSNLDAKLRTQLRAELKDLHARLGATFIFVTHDQVEAMSWGTASPS
jgi:sn-glycerol 3-phosphate transport system ATP-binding protein